MKKLFTLILCCVTVFSFAQRNKKPKMAAVFVPGYYINNKNDTVRGQVQINPDDPTSFYRQFAFISGRSKKPKTFLAAQTKAYGFENRDFIALANDGEKVFVERLTTGRLRLLEYHFNGKVNGSPGVETDYFIKDTRAEGENAELQHPKKISKKYYKKSLRPYLEDQPMLWTDLDKFNFDRNKLVQTITEFNQFYASR